MREDVAVMFRSLIAAAGLLIVQSAGAVAEAPTTFPFCSWWAEITANTVNVAFPDSNAAYWTTPFAVTNDLTAIIVEGQYVDGRYFSLTAYNNSGGTYTCPNSAGESQGSELTDFEIAPDQGSENPFQMAVLPPPIGTYTAMLKHPLAVAGANVLPMPDSTCTPPPTTTGPLPSDVGFLVLRAYLPNGGFDQVPLPNISLQYSSGEVVTLPQCRRSPLNGAEIGQFSSAVSAIQQFLTFTPPASRSAVLPVPCGLPGAQACPPDLEFYRPTDSATNSFFPNNDNKYIAALVRPKPHQVLLMRAMGATHTPGTTAEQWQPSMVDLRYWSMCSNVYRPPYSVVSIQEPGGETILGCAADLDTALDSTGYYTYVVSSVEDRPSNAVLNDNYATWLPFSATQPHARHLMILRNMLGDDFSNSVQNCAQGTDSTAIAECEASMGAYYPQTATCPAATFKKGGTAACFQESRLHRN
jgi:hypothetical protein